MTHRRREQKVRSEEPTTNNTQTDAFQAFINKQIGSDWLDLEKHVAWHGGYVLDQVICRRNEKGWQLILKVWRKGRPFVTYWQAESLAEAYELGGQMASKGFFTWEPDKWPSKWLKDALSME